jgi:hypothetical protein
VAVFEPSQTRRSRKNNDNYGEKSLTTRASICSNPRHQQKNLTTPHMKNTYTRLLFCTAALVCTAAWNAHAVNLVNDGGFEASADGNGPHPFSAAWTVNDPSGFSNVGGDSAFAHSGNNYANLGASPGPGHLSQTLTTVAGTFYTLSFYLATDFTPGLGPAAAFEVLWNNVVVFTVAGNAPAFAYTNFIVTGLTATGGATPLEFRYRHDNDFWRLDDVSVSVPEAVSTLWLLLPTLGLVGLAHSRKRAKGLARA